MTKMLTAMLDTFLTVAYAKNPSWSGLRHRYSSLDSESLRDGAMFVNRVFLEQIFVDGFPDLF